MRTNVSRAINDANRLVWQRRTTGDITHISYEGRRTTHQYKWFQLKSSAPILNQQSMREYSQWCVLAVLVVWVCPRHTSKKMRHHRWRHIDNLKRQLKESFARAHTIRLGIFLYSYCQFMALCMLCEIDRNLNFKIRNQEIYANLKSLRSLKGLIFIFQILICTLCTRSTSHICLSCNPSCFVCLPHRTSDCDLW